MTCPEGTILMVKLNLRLQCLCDYSNASILASGTITITGAGNDDAARNLYDRNKGVIFKIVHHVLNA